MVEAARAAAAAMGSFELLARTAVEIAGVWTVTWLITSFIRSLCSRAGRVSTPVSWRQASLCRSMHNSPQKHKVLCICALDNAKGE